MDKLTIEKKRRRKVLNKHVQVKYALMLSIVMIALLGISQLYTYLTLQTILPSVLSTEVGHKIIAIQMNLLLIGVIYIILISWMSIYVTHRLAGPVTRMEKDIIQLAEKPDLSIRFKVRVGDEFQELPEQLNNLMDKFESHYIKK